jgi:hypothetical protein
MTTSPRNVPPFGNILPPPSYVDQQQAYDPYAKGKRPLEGGGRGQARKAQRTDTNNDRKNKGKGKPLSSSIFPRFREHYYPFVWQAEAHYLYELYEYKALPKRDVKLSLTKLETLLWARTPTEEDIDSLHKISTTLPPKPIDQWPALQRTEDISKDVPRIPPEVIRPSGPQNSSSNPRSRLSTRTSYKDGT